MLKKFKRAAPVRLPLTRENQLRNVASSLSVAGVGWLMITRPPLILMEMDDDSGKEENLNHLSIGRKLNLNLTPVFNRN
jgi:hypothetical protein